VGQFPSPKPYQRSGRTVIVVDASVLVSALGDDGVDGDQARTRLRRDRLAAPELIDLEVSSVLRRLVLSGQLLARRAELALSDLVTLPIRRVSHRVLLPRCWSLRDNLTIYDASYVALAEHLDVVLVTADAGLSRSPGLRCDIEVITRSLEGPAPPP
jgi:predicted nucleic acid-binding protein